MILWATPSAAGPRSRPGFLLFFGGFWYPWVSFGMLGTSPLASWGTLGRSCGDPGAVLGRSWDDPGTFEGTRKDPVRPRLGFNRFSGDLGYPFRKLLGYFWIQKEHVFISISRLLFLLVFVSKFRCLGLEKHAFGLEGIAKINFRSNWISHDSRAHFS